MAKEKLIIDVYQTEDGEQLFLLTPAKSVPKILMPNCCIDSGFFKSEGELNDHLEEHKDEIDLVKDYRDGA